MKNCSSYAVKVSLCLLYTWHNSIITILHSITHALPGFGILEYMFTQIVVVAKTSKIQNFE